MNYEPLHAFAEKHRVSYNELCTALREAIAAPMPEPKRMKYADACALMPEGVYWGDLLTPQIARELAEAGSAHAAAVIAAKDAEIAGLRAEAAQLRADAIDRQNNVVMPLRRRVDVLEDEAAALRAEYERACKLVADMHAAAMGAKVGPLLDVVGDVAAVVHKNTALQERIKVLEDALQRYVNYDLLTGTRGKMNEIAHAALGDKTP